MDGTNKRLVVPIRTRSAIAMHSSEGAGGIDILSVHTRSPIRVQTTATEAPAYGSQPILKELMEQLRKEVGDYPLTAIIHGWDDQLVRSFLPVLFLSLQSEDALWLIPTSNMDEIATPPAQERAVILNPNRLIKEPAYNADRALYDNLIGDIVFFPALEEAEVRYAAGFQQRARTLIVYRYGPCTDAVIRAGREAGFSPYLWSEGQLLEACSDIGEASALAKETQTDAEPDMSDIGRMLKAVAEHLEPGFDRRREFRSQIEKLLEEYPGRREEWNQELVRLADAYQWPSWAVECLPSFYVSLPTSPDGFSRVLLWYRIYECTPDTLDKEVVRELCEGEFFEIKVPAETARVTEEIAQIFEEHRSALPYASGRSFFGAINNAMLQVEAFLSEKYPDAAQKIKALREAILEREQIIPPSTTDDTTA
jgi:hypothetical protein